MMNVSPLRDCTRALAGALAFGIAASANAQPAWKPERAVEIVVFAAPGGGNDKSARVMEVLSIGV